MNDHPATTHPSRACGVVLQALKDGAADTAWELALVVEMPETLVRGALDVLMADGVAIVVGVDRDGDVFVYDEEMYARVHAS